MAVDVDESREISALRGSEISSQIREREFDAPARAQRRVAEYLRALGLHAAARVEQLSEEITVSAFEKMSRVSDVPDATRDSSTRAPTLVQAAVAEAQERYGAFLQDVFGRPADGGVERLDALWLRAFIAACPSEFLGDVNLARAAALRFGDPWAGRANARANFRDQTLRRVQLPSWLLGALPPLLLTGAASYALLGAAFRNGGSPLQLLWAALFTFLFGLGSVGLNVATIGFFTRSTPFIPRERASRVSLPSVSAVAEADNEALPRSALLMPIYEENAEHVFAALAAMRESLEATPGGEAFEIFVLSDSRRPEQAAEEERAFRRIASAGGPIGIYYRRRARNDRQKAGNLAEFFERFGHRYTYAVVLDADSLMRGETLVEMLRRMQASPRLALLQAPLALHGGTTLFARAQQFAASVSGPIFMRGLSTWAGAQANYYGHNAALRVNAFLECCALPVLAGEPPLGGLILSHDFVEAALLCRAGWEVRMAHDLGGSWEELPETLPEYVARDRRWCQGNMQHLRIAGSEGLRAMSRIHMLVGAASYLAGPAWLVFTLLSVVLSLQGALLPTQVAIALAVLTALLLLAPRWLGVIATLRERRTRLAHGGVLSVCAGALLETALAACSAPLLMLHHTRIVLSIVAGGSVGWTAQKRRSRGVLSAIVYGELPAMLLGIVSAFWLWQKAPALLWWLAPLWVPMCLAIPIAWLLSNASVGQWMRRLSLLLVPSETEPDELVSRVGDLRALTTSDESARFRDLVLDPLLMGAHVARLEDAPLGKKPHKPTSHETLQRLQQRALRAGPAALSPHERATLMADANSMRFLHREAWRTWPVESWQLARDVPQLPTGE